MVEVLGGRELRRFPNPAGGIMHAEVRIEDTVIMVADAPDERRPVPSNVHVYVSDVDDIYRRALAAGAISVKEPARVGDDDPVRRGGVVGPGGTTWWLATQQQSTD